MRIQPVRGRALGGVLALAGVLALIPSIFWPTSSFSYPAVDDPAFPDQQRLVNLTWSWGKYGIEHAPDGFGGDSAPSNTFGLVFLVMALGAGAAGALAWMLLRGVHGRLLGVAGTAVLASYAGHTVFQRVGQNLLFLGPDDALVLETPPAGVLENVSPVLLAASLVVMLWRSLLAGVRSAWKGVSAWAAAARVVDESAGQVADGDERGRVILHGERRVDGPVTPGAGAGGPAESIGFTDPSTGDDRFRPPKQA